MEPSGSDEPDELNAHSRSVHELVNAAMGGTFVWPLVISM
jgi:hypothetical protein